MHEQLELVNWLGRIGAARADDLARRFALSPQAMRACLRRCERAGLVEANRLLHREAPLYVATRAGLRAAECADLGCARVSVSGFAHMREVARAAVALERSLPLRYVMGERELRRAERDAGALLASAEVGPAYDPRRAVHRPDLVVWEREPGAHPIAIEVELTVKAPLRLRAIVRGWARSRLVSGVVYYATADAARAVRSAVTREQAVGRVQVVGLSALDDLSAERFPADRRVPSQAERSFG